MMCHKWVKENGSKPDFKPLHLPKLLMVLVGIVALIAVSSWLLHNLIARWALAPFPPASYWCSPRKPSPCTAPHAAR